MERFIVFVKNQSSCYNIFNLDIEKLQKVVHEYLLGNEKFFVGGITFYFKNIFRIAIFKFNDVTNSERFEEFARQNRLFRTERFISGLFIPPEVLKLYGLDVTESFITGGFGSLKPLPDPKPKTVETMDIFISHSNIDTYLANALIRLIEKALKLKATAIRCSSVDGYRLPGGAKIDETIRKEIHESKVFIALLTSHSMESTYVLFEMGARWAIEGYLLPIICQPDGKSLVNGPLKSLNVLDGKREPELHQLISDLSGYLGVAPEPPASYLAEIKEFAIICSQSVEVNLPPLLDSQLNIEVKAGDYSELKFLSDKAKVILKKTSEAKDGDILVFTMLDSYELICGTTNIGCTSHREFTEWESAVQQLLLNELIVFEGQRDAALYRLTDKGYRVADKIVLDT